jgi:ComF family protein
MPAMPSILQIKSNAMSQRLRETAKNLFVKVVDAFYPRVCVYCESLSDDQGPFLCAPCRDSIVLVADPCCHRCGFPADISYDYPHPEFECGLCRKGSFVFDRARSLGLYESALKQLIHHFKYRKQPGAMKEIAPLIEAYFPKPSETYEGFHVVPVPLHSNKLLERGFDQSYLIAQSVAGRMQLPLYDHLLTRIKPTESQTRKKKHARLENMRGAFQVNPSSAVTGKDILLVDDVFTTGATVNEAAKVFKKAGAGRVYVFTLARA